MDRLEQKKLAAKNEREFRDEIRKKEGKEKPEEEAVERELYDCFDMRVDRHWTDKVLDEMTERDWRIFNEDLNISYKLKGPSATIPRPMRSWAESKLSAELLKAVERADHKKPSPIQMAEKAWNLFEEKVGRETLGIHPDIQELAKTVAKECGGLLLALITVGRAMACKKTTQEWNHAIHILKNSSSEFSGMENKVLHLLKFSYDNLTDEKVRSCFLYCALYPEDFFIFKDDLVYLWMCEAMLDEYGSVEEAKNKCYEIIGTLVAACLLEVDLDMVKMHDMIRDMALWLARDCGKESDSFLVNTSAHAASDVKKWKTATRVSLVDNHIERLVETPKSY